MYLPTANVEIFPSSNATTKGKITSEKNIREITSKLKITNFKSSVSDFTLTYSSSTLTVGTGYGYIDGYWLHISNAVTLSNPSTTGTKHILLYLVYDISGNVLGDVGSDNQGVNLGVFAENDANYPTSFLKIGEFNNDVLSQNDLCIYPFDLEALPNPDGDGDLQTFLGTTIPTTYLSKVANDNKIGNARFVDDLTTPTKYTKVTEDDIDIGNVVSGNDVSSLNITVNHDSSVVGTISGTQIDLVASSKIVQTAGAPSTKSTVTLEDNTITSNAKTTVKTQIDGVDSFAVTSTGVSVGSNVSISKTGVIDNSTDTLKLHGNGGVTAQGNFTATGDIHANKVYNAVFNDGVEFMEKEFPEEDIKAGDVVCFTEYGTVTKVKDSKDVYRLCGVVSSEDTYGWALGGDGLEDNEKVPVALFGRVRLNTQGINLFECGDLVAVKEDGTGLEVVQEINRRVLGKVTETKFDTKDFVTIKIMY